MPVIINDFEVVSEPPAPRAETGGAQAPAGAPPQGRPEDAARALAQYQERLLRVLAD